jgi:hypothetical protein
LDVISRTLLVNGGDMPHDWGKMHGPEIVARTLSNTAIPDKFGNLWQYHSRSDRHSKAACWGILFDLMQSSKVLAAHVKSEELGFGINHEMVDYKNSRKKNLDLVLCQPREAETKKKPQTFSSLVRGYGIVLTPDERELLGGLPVLTETPVGSVRIALEAKACMTAHVKALPRLYDELNSSHQTVHGSSDMVIAAAFVMVNIADWFISTELNRYSLKKKKPVVSRHRQPGDCQRVIDKAQEIPRRTGSTDPGFDALAIVVVDCKNDGSPVTLRSTSPAPDAADIYRYEQMIRRTAQAYDFRFGRT